MDFIDGLLYIWSKIGWQTARISRTRKTFDRNVVTMPMWEFATGSGAYKKVESRPEYLMPNSPMWNYGKRGKFKSPAKERLEMLARLPASFPPDWKAPIQSIDETISSRIEGLDDEQKKKVLEFIEELYPSIRKS